MAKTMEQEILAVYGLDKRKRGESDQTYFERIVRASNNGSDEQWSALDKVPGAQDWINAGGQALQDGKDISAFPDSAGESEGDNEPRARRGAAEAEAADEQRPARKAAGKGKASAKAAPKAKAKVKAEAKDDAKDEPAPRARRVVAEAPAPKPTARKRGNGGSGVYAQTQEFVVRNPNATTQDIMKALQKKGLEPQQHTVQSVRGHTRDTIKLMQRIHKTDFGIEA